STTLFRSRPVVAIVGITVAGARRIGLAQTGDLVGVVALASRAVTVVAIGRRPVAVVVGLRGGGAARQQQHDGKGDPRGLHVQLPAPDVGRDDTLGGAG